MWWRGAVLALVPLVYPSGRLWRGLSSLRRLFHIVAVAAVLGAGLCNALTFAAVDFVTFTPYGWVEPFERSFGTMLRSVAVIALVAQADLVARVLRMTPTDRRRHALFVLVGIALTVPTWLSLAQSIGWVRGYDWPELEFVPALLLPVALASGVLRHGSLEFRTVVRRTVFYTGVTLISAVLYLVVVGAFAAALEDGVGVGPVVATGLVAVTLHPVRAVVQRCVDRSVFGDRDDPDHALAGLSRRLGDASSEPLAVVAEVVRSSLKLATVALVWIDDNGDEVVGGMAGGAAPAGGERRVPILFEGRRVGDLVVHAAEGAAPPNAAEERLLAELAGAAGAVVRAVRSTDAMFVRAITTLLADEPDVHVVAAVGTGDEAVRAALEHQPDVVLMDLYMPDLNGIEAARLLAEAAPHTGVLVLTMFDDDDWIAAALRAGARGYLLKGARQDELARAIRSVHAGDLIIGQPLVRRVGRLLTEHGPIDPRPFPALTDRELEVLDQLARGLDNSAIGKALYLSEKTVRNYVSGIFAKLGVASRAEAVVSAREAGLGRASSG